ncbi:MAG: amino acid ABC transporter ATP-binding protein [Erysipelotrichaceae bacterium]|nr:amino acid ABC transporter ATP-binding protein [Erysipelotrichaceae bacterium]
MIELKNLKKKFNSNYVLNDISFKVEKGDIISIIGPSGCGKTTLLRCMNFLNTSDEGYLTFDDETYDMANINKKEINNIRKKTAFVFQNYNLFLNKTALENVIEGLIIARKIAKNEAIKIGEEMLEKVGMLERKDHYPSQLSGGQQQRVAIARALALNPEIIYFDEPTSALDPELIGEVLEVIKQLALEKRTMIIVSHEMRFVRSISTKVIFMEGGHIVEEGTPKDIFENPKEERTKEFLDSYRREL